MEYNQIRLKAALDKLFQAQSELQEIFRETKLDFTPDGHLVGDLGGALAAAHYGLTPAAVD